MIKKGLYIIVCLLFFTSMANAQKKDSTGNKRAEMIKELNLNADQKKKADSIHRETRKQKQVIQNDNSLTTEQKQQKIKELNQQEKSKMHAFLTPEQRQKVRDNRQNRKKKDADSTGSNVQ